MPVSPPGSSGDAREADFTGRPSLFAASLVVMLAMSAASPSDAAERPMTWGVQVSLAWFDPAETPGIITLFIPLYALHDAMVRPSAGFDSVWLGEHHNGTLLYPAPLVGLAAIARRTRRVRLGTGVLLLPLYHPLAVTEEGRW